MNNLNVEKIDKVYFLTDGEYIKIGFTSGAIQSRIQQLQTGCANKIYEIGYILGGKDKESELHRFFANIRKNGTEWFQPSDKLVEFINENNLNQNIYLFKDGDKVYPCQSVKII